MSIGAVIVLLIIAWVLIGKRAKSYRLTPGHQASLLGSGLMLMERRSVRRWAIGLGVAGLLTGLIISVPAILWFLAMEPC